MSKNGNIRANEKHGGEIKPAVQPSLFVRIKERCGVQSVLIASFFVVLWALLAFYESALLHRIDNLSLFLFNDVYFDDMTSVPAGLLSYIGCFLIQLFHYPPLGAAVYVLLLYLVYRLTRKVFDVSGNYALLAMVPVFALLASNTQLGYWIFYLKLPGYYFIAVVAVLVSLLAMWGFKKLGHLWRMPYLLVWTVVGYPLFGVYALFFSLLMGVTGISQALGRRKGWMFPAATFALSLVLAYFVPRYFYYYYTVDSELVHYAGIPVLEWWFGALSESEYELKTFWSSMGVYRVPFYLLSVSFVLLAASLYLRTLRFSKNRFMKYLPYTAFVLCMLFGVRYWYNDTNFRIENKQNLAMWEGDWNSVAEYAKETDAPTRMIVVNKNVAMLKKGLRQKGYFGAGDRCIEPNSPMGIRMQHIGGYDTYFHYGKMNYCYRWCMENSVEYGWRPEYLKNAVRSMIAAGEYKLAKRYINILKQTMFHASWALEMEKFIEKPELAKTSAELAQPVHLNNFTDLLATDVSIEEYLMTNVNTAARRRELDDFMCKALIERDADAFKEYMGERKELSEIYWHSTLLMPLVKKDLNRFVFLINDYFQTKNLQDPSLWIVLPKACQEALHLYKGIDKSNTLQVSPDFLKKIAGDGSVFANFIQQYRTAQKNLSNKYPNITEKRKNAIIAELLKKQYGETYYYYYFFVKDIKTY